MLQHGLNLCIFGLWAIWAIFPMLDQWSSMTLFAAVPFLANVGFFIGLDLKGLGDYITVPQGYVISLALILVGVY